MRRAADAVARQTLRAMSRLEAIASQSTIHNSASATRGRLMRTASGRSGAVSSGIATASTAAIASVLPARSWLSSSHSENSAADRSGAGNSRFIGVAIPVVIGSAAEGPGTTVADITASI